MAHYGFKASSACPDFDSTYEAGQDSDFVGLAPAGMPLLYTKTGTRVEYYKGDQGNRLSDGAPPDDNPSFVVGFAARKGGPEGYSSVWRMKWLGGDDYDTGWLW